MSRAFYMRILYYACLLPFLVSVKSNAQKPWPENYYSETISTNDGLSSLYVTTFLKDKHGFMWIGTSNGLNRFDGYDIKTHLHVEHNKQSLSDNHILSLCEDHQGMIWVGTMYGGLNRYNPENESFKSYSLEINDTLELRDYAVFDIVTYDADNIWFAVQSPVTESIYCLNPNTGLIRNIADFIDNSIQIPFIHCHDIQKDREGILWIGFQEGIIRFDPMNRSLEAFRIDHYKHTFSREGMEIFEDNSGKLWFGTWGGGLYQFKKHERELVHIDLEQKFPDNESHNFIAALDEDQEGKLIIRTSGGILLMYNTGLFSEIPYPRSDFRNLYNTQQSLFYDSDGLLWLGTHTNEGIQPGICKIYLRNKDFNHWTTDMLNIDQDALFWISAFYKDKSGARWIGGSPMGLRKYKSDLVNPVPEQIQHAQNIPYDLSMQFISAVYGDRSSNLWIGGWWDGTLYKIDSSGSTAYEAPKKQIIERSKKGVYTSETMFIQLDDTPFSGAGSMRIHELKDGKLLLARGTGVELFDPQTEHFQVLEFMSESVDNIELPLFTSIAEDESGNIWLGSMHRGLFRISPPFHTHSDGSAYPENIRSYKTDKDLPKDLGELMITSLCIPEDQTRIALWIGTKGGGLFGLTNAESSDNSENGLFVNYSAEDGLCNDIIYGILEDSKGYLWISTENGLSRFNPKTSIFRNFDAADGVPLKTFHWLSSYTSQDGSMYFGGNEGVLTFHPDSISEYPNHSKVVITDFRLFNKPVKFGSNSPLKRPVIVSDELDLSYKENYLSFEFAALNFAHSEKNMYQYQLVGADRQWIQSGTNRTASYSNLRHGKYVFKVKSANSDGIWNENDTSLKIHIQAPPWLSWWAYCLYAILITALILWYRNYLLNRNRLQAAIELERMEKEKIRELEQLKSRFLANLSHEFRTPLTLLLGPINDLINNYEEKKITDKVVLEGMKRNAERLRQLINQLLDLSKIESGKMQLRVSKGDLTGFTTVLCGSFISLAESRGIKYSYDVVDRDEELYFDPDKIEKVLTNLISNALKFTQRGGTIKIIHGYEMNTDEDPGLFVVYKISDTGPGIPAEEQDKIFDRFYQVNMDNSRTEEGSGIGLALTRELIDLYRGSISLESEPEKGSLFTVRLPVSENLFKANEIEDHSTPTPANDTAQDHRDKVSQLTDDESVDPDISEVKEALILIVEDNEDLRKYISSNLQSDYKILEAENGISGMSTAREHIPDLIISDLMMPKMDGVEMCEKLKNDHLTSHIPLVMLTARADKESKLDSFETGADDYIIKPFDAEELKARVDNLIEQRKKLRENYRKEFLVYPQNQVRSKYVDEFLVRVTSMLSEKMSDAEYNVKQLAHDLNLSESQLYRKLVALSDLSPNEFIRNSRLRKASEMFQQGHTNIASVLYEVGFNTPSHFTKCFKELYGLIPSEYIKNLSLGKPE